MNRTPAVAAPPAAWRSLLLRALMLAGLWWVLSGGAPGSWVVGVPVIALALWTSMKLAPSSLPFSLPAAFAFFGFFLVQSFKGGVQVALFALSPRTALQPVELELPLRLVPGHAQLLLATAVSLMPGTLTISLEHSRLRLHVLDARLPAEEEVRAAEDRIARIFRLRLT